MNIRSVLSADIVHLDFTLDLRARSTTRVKHPDWPDGKGLRKDIGFFTGRGQGFGLVAERDGEIFGFVGCAGPVRERTAIQLHGPVVAGGARQQGVGSKLLGHALAAGRKVYAPGCSVVNWMSAENIAGSALLKKFHFEIPYAEWFMRCEEEVASIPRLPGGWRVRGVRDREGITRSYGIYGATWSGKKSVDSFHADVSSPPNGMYLLEDGSGALAFFILMARSNGNVDIEYFAVRPDVRGQGVGSMLMRHALPMIREETGGRPVTLTVHTDNDPAIRLYEGAGFRKLYAMDCWQFVL